MKTNFSIHFSSIVLCLLILAGFTKLPAQILISSDTESPQIQFAVNEIKKILSEKGIKLVHGDVNDADISISVQPGTEKISTEGFILKKEQGKIKIIALDDAGAMYGGLELAEQIQVYGLEGVSDQVQNPYMMMRGTKFNIPLDARTPSYSDLGDAGQENIAEMWNMDFWTNYIDQLARARYNFISLWNLHPFPSMVQVPEYPDIALEDVKRCTADFPDFDPQKKELKNNTWMITDNNLVTVKKMSMAEKIAFWQNVMHYARDRNITFYIVTWNIYVNGVDQSKYDLSEKADDKKTIDYFRKSVKQMYLTYPDLGGIGLTTGENMNRYTSEEKEKWAFETYGLGLLDAAAEQPDRKFVFIHRQHQTAATAVLDQFKPLRDNKNIDFIFSFKYAKAHVYSSLTQPGNKDFVDDIDANDAKTIWTLRNDDIYYFRWGAPDYVREFIKNIPYDVSQGYYFGSDGYIWGREFVSTEPESPRQFEIDKHWYHWMLWGRLGYNPVLSDERFKGILDARFPEVSGSDLFTAWQEASMVYPVVTGFHWGMLDVHWYIEGCMGNVNWKINKEYSYENGFHGLESFINYPVHGTSGNQSIVDFAGNGKREGKRTPFELADLLYQHCNNAFSLIETLDAGSNKELRLTIGDIRTIASMGMYYVHKIRGATYTAMYRISDKRTEQEAAIDELNAAAHWWRVYVSNAVSQYKNPMWLSRVGTMDWRKNMADVLTDIKIAGGKPDLVSMKPTPGGRIIKPKVQSDNVCEFEFTVEQPGLYAFEVSYALAEGQHPATVTINGAKAGELIFWSTGGSDVLGWDHMYQELDKGKKLIRIEGNLPDIQHLNLIRD